MTDRVCRPCLKCGKEVIAFVSSPIDKARQVLVTFIHEDDRAEGEGCKMALAPEFVETLMAGAIVEYLGETEPGIH